MTTDHPFVAALARELLCGTWLWCVIELAEQSPERLQHKVARALVPNRLPFSIGPETLLLSIKLGRLFLIPSEVRASMRQISITLVPRELLPRPDTQENLPGYSSCSTHGKCKETSRLSSQSTQYHRCNVFSELYTLCLRDHTIGPTPQSRCSLLPVL